MTGFGDEPAGVTGARSLAKRRPQGVDPQKILAVQVIRAIHDHGGKASLTKLTNGRAARRQVLHALQLAARERLVTSSDAGRTWTLTQQARDLVAQHPVDEQAAAT